MDDQSWMRAWHPAVPGVREVLHARMTDHAYPPHVHADWAILLVDEGAVAYELGGRARIADASAVTLLPPGVAHDGRAAHQSPGFRKRVAYLHSSWMPEGRTGGIVDQPSRRDLVTAARNAHRALATPGEELAAEATLLALASRLASGVDEPRRVKHDSTLARRLRDLLEARLVDGITLDEAGRLLGAHPSHLARAFATEFGAPPHRYVTSRRVDLARRLLLDGARPAFVAVKAGFHDQAHLTRHFRKVLGTTPGRFATAHAQPHGDSRARKLS
jgi:AraC-like DNA-binding protein